MKGQEEWGCGQGEQLFYIFFVSWKNYFETWNSPAENYTYDNIWYVS